MMSLTGQIEKLKSLVQQSTNCAGAGDERRKGNCRSQWWKHSTVVGGGLQTPSDKSKVTIVIRIMNLLILFPRPFECALNKTAMTSGLNAPDAPLLFWLLNSSCEWQIAMFLNWWNLFLAKTIPQINKEYLLLTPGFWGKSVNKEIIDYPALVEQIVSLCSFPNLKGTSVVKGALWEGCQSAR